MGSCKCSLSFPITTKTVSSHIQIREINRNTCWKTLIIEYYTNTDQVNLCTKEKESSYLHSDTSGGHFRRDDAHSYSTGQHRGLILPSQLEAGLWRAWRCLVTDPDRPHLLLCSQYWWPAFRLGRGAAPEGCCMEQLLFLH